jgi:hypothetical protein
LSLRSQGVIVKIFDKKGNLLKIFPTITSAAKYFGVSNKMISRIPNMGIYNDKFIFKYELKDLRVWIYDANNKLLMITNNAKKAAEWCNIPFSTMDDYIKSSNLYKNKYFFYNSKSNPYLNKNN